MSDLDLQERQDCVHITDVSIPIIKKKGHNNTDYAVVSLMYTR